MKFRVTVQRTEIRETDLEITAMSIADAETVALQQAGSFDFHDARFSDAEYSVSSSERIPDVDSDEFECERCGLIADNDDSVRLGDELVCSECSEEQDRRDEKNGLYPEKWDDAN